MNLPKYITFDCYGTLIDFQINKTTVDILGERAEAVDLHGFLVVFRDIRYYECHAPYQRYSDLLRTSFKKAMDQCGLRYKNSDGDRLVAAVPTWGPFPDTKPVLDQLGKYCKLVIISNAEDDMMAQNVKNMDVAFYDVITAEQARAYKPTPPIFYYALRHRAGRLDPGNRSCGSRVRRVRRRRNGSRGARRRAATSSLSGDARVSVAGSR